MQVKEGELPKPLEKLSEAEIGRKMAVAKISTEVLSHLTRSFTERGFQWFLPVVFSKTTDPLWPDPGASIEKRVDAEVYGETVRTTLSMIVHKLVACSLACPKLFVLSPNVRIEKRERRFTGWHAYEFTQLDFESRGSLSGDVMRLCEEVVCGLVANVKEKLTEELSYLGTSDELRVPSAPFRVFDRAELLKEYGEGWEGRLPADVKEPVWVTNIPREFYDFENPSTGEWDNYDLIVPKYGEILSGARREWEYERIAKKMTRDGVRKENYSLLLGLAKEGRLRPTAGAGFGIERMVTWIAGAKHIGEVQPFPRIPGVVDDL